MKLEDKALRVGAAAILAAILLRILLPINFSYLFTADGIMSLMLYAGTGRWAQVEHTPQTPATPQEEFVQAVFSTQELNAIILRNPLNYTVDLQQALCTPLDWNLNSGQPTVLILHTHTTEGFTNSADWRSQDERYNMISIGNRVAQLLEQAGIQVIHDRSIHDLPSYDDAYESSRAAIQEYLAQYPSIQLVLDLHRDAYENEKGEQLGFTVNYNGQKAATMMLLVSAYDYHTTDATWKHNLAFATKLQLQLEQLCPGICSPMTLRSYSYGQDISPTGLLIEMGYAGNKQEEVLRSAEILANAIISLQYGRQTIIAANAH